MEQELQNINKRIDDLSLKITQRFDELLNRIVKLERTSSVLIPIEESPPPLPPPSTSDLTIDDWIGLLSKRSAESKSSLVEFHPHSTGDEVITKRGLCKLDGNKKEYLCIRLVDQDKYAMLDNIYVRFTHTLGGCVLCVKQEQKTKRAADICAFENEKGGMVKFGSNGKIKLSHLHLQQTGSFCLKAFFFTKEGNKYVPLIYPEGSAVPLILSLELNAKSHIKMTEKGKLRHRNNAIPNKNTTSVTVLDNSHYVDNVSKFIRIDPPLGFAMNSNIVKLIVDISGIYTPYVSFNNQSSEVISRDRNTITCKTPQLLEGQAAVTLTIFKDETLAEIPCSTDNTYHYVQPSQNRATAVINNNTFTCVQSSQNQATPIINDNSENIFTYVQLSQNLATPIMNDDSIIRSFSNDMDMAQ
jgi:hypothetical protein